MKSEVPSISTAHTMPAQRSVQICATCLAWKVKPNQSAPIFGGCARSGKTTLHYGDTAYNHYTTDLQCCSAWEAK